MARSCCRNDMNSCECMTRSPCQCHEEGTPGPAGVVIRRLKWNYCLLVCLTTIIVMLQGTLVTAQEIATVTSNENDVIQGSSKNLTCSYTTRNQADEVYILTWRFGKDLQLGTAVNLVSYVKDTSTPVYSDGYGPPGYQMSIDDIRLGGGSSVLTIGSLDYKEHEGRYWCIVSVLTYSFFYGSYDANVSVMPSNVTLSIDGNTTEETMYILEMNEEHSFMVSVFAAKPAAEITWTLGGKTLQGKQQNTENPIDSRLSDSINTVGPIRVTENTILRCSVKVPGDAGIIKEVRLVAGDSVPTLGPTLMPTSTSTSDDQPLPPGSHGVKLDVTLHLLVIGLLVTMI